MVRPADASESDCSDWTSHSRDMGAVEVGVATEKAAVEGVDAVWDWAAAATALKEVRRFWAEDLRRIFGRCICASTGAMDIT